MTLKFFHSRLLCLALRRGAVLAVLGAAFILNCGSLGAQWRRIDMPPEADSATRGHAIVVTGLSATSTSLFVLVNQQQGGLYRTQDLQHWDALDTSLVATNAQIGRAGDDIYLVNTFDKVYRLPESGTTMVQIGDNVPRLGRTIWDGELFYNRRAPMLVKAGGRLFCASDSGVYRLSEDGKHWARLTIPDTLLIANLIAHNDTLYLYGSTGMFTSVDMGDTWQLLFANPDPFPTGLEQLYGPGAIYYPPDALVVRDDAILLVTPERSWFRYDRAADTLARLHEGQRGFVAHAVVDLGPILCASMDRGYLYRYSIDGGITWWHDTAVAEELKERWLLSYGITNVVHFHDMLVTSPFDRGGRFTPTAINWLFVRPASDVFPQADVQVVAGDRSVAVGEWQPNPSHEEAWLEVVSPDVECAVMSADGHPVPAEALVVERTTGGIRVHFRAGRVAPGVYVARVVRAGAVEHRRLIVLH